MVDHCIKSDRKAFVVNKHQRAAICPRGHENINVDDLLSASRRKNIRKARKRLGEKGKVTVERLSDAKSLNDWIENFLAMEDSGWKHEEGSSILSSKDETSLYRALIREAFDNETLNFTRLCVDGTAIAYTLDVTAAPHGYCLKSAIDQNYRKYSPGVLMEYETLQHYLGKDEFALIDSCSAPDNSMLNDLWPDRKMLFDLVIGREGPLYRSTSELIYMIKSRTKTATAV